MLNSKFNNTLSMPISPTHTGAQSKEVTIDLQRVGKPFKKSKKHKSPSAYLLIGFDTEFQTIDPIDRDELEYQPQNEVLSYQYCIKLLKRDGDQTEDICTSGIIVPDNGERITIEQFICFAVGDLMQAFPDVIIPADIYLIGHFLRADLPAFDGFSKLAKAMASNVRSTFVSINHYQKLKVHNTPCDKGTKEQYAEFRIRMRDTVLLAPANARSLAEVGEIVGLPKISLANDPESELRIKENMATFLKDDWPKFQEYAIRDAEVCVRFAEQLIAESNHLFDDFSLPITLTSYGTKLVLEDWEERGWNRDTILGRESLPEKRYIKKRNRYHKAKVRPLLDVVHHHEAFAIECFHGGRNEQFHFGPAHHGDWKDIDLSSAYTTAMSLIGLPEWDKIKPLDTLEGVQPTDLSLFLVEFEFPEDVRYPTLPIRTDNGIIFPRKGRAHCCAPEIVLAQQLGAKLELISAVTVPTNRDVPIFGSFIQKCITKRGEFAKGSFHNLFWKEVGNSTYGKTAQGLKKRRVYDLRADDMAELPQSALTQPFFAAFITSFTRAVLGEVINALPNSTTVFSVTTDGFLTDADNDQIAQSITGPLARQFSKARHTLVGDDNPVEIKHQIRQPIGWRTRGSATIVPGLCTGNNIVLQKGGIKTSTAMDADQQNSHIINLFLNREPGQKIEYTTGLGIKDMMRFEADFVSVNVRKRLSMEFDWKRRPVEPRDATFVFEGSQHTHLAFDTEPLEDIEEFRQYRDSWEKFSFNPFRCLKSLSEYQQFDTYVRTQRMPKDINTYIRKDNGDIARLRRDLTRAFKHQQAGFASIIERMGKITHERFCSILQEFGIKCRVSDLDNAKRAQFSPHEVVDTPRVTQALKGLKDTYFCELEIDTLLASG